MNKLLSLLAKVPFWFKFQCGFGKAKASCSLNWEMVPWDFKIDYLDPNLDRESVEARLRSRLAVRDVPEQDANRELK